MDEPDKKSEEKKKPDEPKPKNPFVKRMKMSDFQPDESLIDRSIGDALRGKTGEAGKEAK